MKICCSYTILDIIEVPDNASADDIDEIVHNNASELGFEHLVNDFEWSEHT